MSWKRLVNLVGDEGCLLRCWDKWFSGSVNENAEKHNNFMLIVSDTMGEKYHFRWTTWIPAFLVVVSGNLNKKHTAAGSAVHFKSLMFRSRGLMYFWFFSVFWDLYCAAPERRDTCEHSSEAKAFHDYVRFCYQKYCRCCSSAMI